VFLAVILLPCRPATGGVTVITHGFELDSSYPGWISAIADEIPNYYSFHGTNFTTYRIAVTYNNGYYVAWNRTNGISPSASDSGEIIIELDWSQISGNVSASYASTYNVAWPVTWALTQTNLIPELNGHALAEFPIHLVGHSRGGSLMSEVSRQLGTNGIWVDHLTTLDPYPINNDGNLNFPATVVDAPVHSYANVLFADNYWQDLGAGFLFGDPDGEPVAGAYIRQLVNLPGGYSSYHSDVHLWYFGTVDLDVPASNGEATITATERQNWWVPYEYYGLFAGFYYSLIAGGDRLSTDQPLGSGTSFVVDGFNQWWDLGAGTSNNRTTVSPNNGNWPNLIRLNRMSTNQVVQGQSTPVKFYYQWGRTNIGNATVSFYLDNDFNPLNGNSTLVSQVTVPGTGPSSVFYATVNLQLNSTNATPGYHSLFAKITGGAQTRYLYAPELVDVISAPRPILEIATLSNTQFVIGVNGIAGQTIVLQTSTNLLNWLPLATNTLAGNRWTYTNNSPVSIGDRFFRAVQQLGL
jgi:hypothetical protein